jgi:hypothetical protein
MSSGGPKKKPELKVDTAGLPDGGTESRNEDGVSPLTPEEEQGNRPKSPQFAETTRQRTHISVSHWDDLYSGVSYTRPRN